MRHKRSKKAVVVIGVATASLLLIIGVLWPGGQRKAIIEGRTYTIEVADTEAEREQGLSGRNSLPADTAMLFIFDQPGQQCFWMKDMQFSLDIIWLDAGRRVVHIEQNVSPSSYPDSFCPPKASQYVVELNAGQARQLGLKQGSVMQF